MLQTESVSYEYNEQTKFSFPNISLVAGNDLLILGESGVGKTTLLHLLAGLLPISGGKIKITGVDIGTLRSSDLDTFRSKNIGVIFQKSYFVKAISLKENLLLVQYLSKKGKDVARINFIAENLGIKHLLNKKPHHLSIGEQQRGSIALALINNPKVILADEPTSSLDDKNCFNVITLLKEQAAKTNAALIIVTHDQRLKEEFKNKISL